MNNLDILKLARKNLWRRKVRTILTTLGVIIGTTSIVVMLSLGIGLNENQRKSMERWGSLTIIRVQPGMSFDSEGKPLGEPKSLNDETVNEFKDIPGVMEVSPAYEIGGEARYGRKRGGLQLIGLDPDSMENLEFKIDKGRLLNSGERNVMVVGSQVINRFHDEAFLRRMEKGIMREGPGMVPEEQNPEEMLDQRISMQLFNGNRESKRIFNFIIVGILEGKYSEHAYQAYAPIEDVKRMQRFLSQGQNNGPMPGREMIVRGGGARVMASPGRSNAQNNADDYSYILIKTADVTETRNVSQIIKDQGYNSWSMADQLEGIEKSSRIIQAILGGIGSITLIVAALGITNTMIMSIYERTREIGIMKVIGASFRDIYYMFLSEAGLIGFFGGLLGITLSYGVSYGINHLSRNYLNQGMPPGEEMVSISLIPSWLAFFALVFAVFIGILAGLYPAHRAVHLSPIKAIRND